MITTGFFKTYLWGPNFRMEGTFWLKRWHWRTVLENIILPKCAKSSKFKIPDNFTKSDVFCPDLFLLLQKGKQCCFMLCIIIFGRFGHLGGISSLLLFTEKVLNPFFVFFLSFLASIFTFFALAFQFWPTWKKFQILLSYISNFQFKAKKNVPKKRKYKLKLMQLWFFKTTVW